LSSWRTQHCRAISGCTGYKRRQGRMSSSFSSLALLLHHAFPRPPHHLPFRRLIRRSGPSSTLLYLSRARRRPVSLSCCPSGFIATHRRRFSSTSSSFPPRPFSRSQHLYLPHKRHLYPLLLLSLSHPFHRRHRSLNLNLQLLSKQRRRTVSLPRRRDLHDPAQLHVVHWSGEPEVRIGSEGRQRGSE
jgi:hypothetical protein